MPLPSAAVSKFWLWCAYIDHTASGCEAEETISERGAVQPSGNCVFTSVSDAVVTTEKQGGSKWDLKRSVLLAINVKIAQQLVIQTDCFLQLELANPLHVLLLAEQGYRSSQRSSRELPSQCATPGHVEN